MQLNLRPELDTDYQPIESLLDSAFGGQYESQLVNRIRNTPEYINDLTLVAVAGEQIVGFIMLSYVTLVSAHTESQVLSLAPVAIMPTYQKRGIGGRLIQESIRIAEHRGDPLIVLLGHADYYPRFGFERASLHNIYPPVDWPDQTYMVRTLSKFTADLEGKIRYSPAWKIV
jgi:putative acetyltransferase